MRNIPHISIRGKSGLAGRRERRTAVPLGVTGLRVRRFLVAAMEQQMWFFGCDAACTNGNLLVRYGFRRDRPEGHRGKSSRYRFLWQPAAAHYRLAGPAAEPFRVDLHGWCAGIHPERHGGAGGFLYVRAGSRLGWYDAPEPPAPGEYDDDPAAVRAFRLLGRDPESGFRRAVSLFLGWVEEYESWVERTCGLDYRRRCHARAPLPWLPPSEARGWLARYRREITPGAANPPRNHPNCQP